MFWSAAASVAIRRALGAVRQHEDSQRTTIVPPPASSASSTAPWTADEDALIVQLVETHGPKWTLIAEKLATSRSDSSVRNRFTRLTSPAQEEKARDRASELPWTTADDEALRVGIARHGFKWRTIIRELLPERTCHA